MVRQSPGRQGREKGLNPGSLRQDIHPLEVHACKKRTLSCTLYQGVVRPRALHRAWSWWEPQRFWSQQVDFINSLQGPGLARGAERKKQEKEDPLELTEQNPQLLGGCEVTPILF